MGKSEFDYKFVAITLEQVYRNNQIKSSQWLITIDYGFFFFS